MKKLIGLALLFVGAIAFMSTTIIAPEGLKIGDTAPEFNLENIDGNMVSLASTASDYKKLGKEVKGYIVTFTCNTCPYAVMYEDRLQALHAEMAPKGWPVVAIQPNNVKAKPADNLPAMKQRAADKGFTFAYLLDKEQTVYPAYGATRTPHVFLLDKDLKVQYIGAIDDNPGDASAVSERYVANAIAALEAGKTADPNFTKAIGCSIKGKVI